jgi:hypothetical protein
MRTEVAQFIANYSDSDAARIRFDWNGQHGDQFVDRNMDFRDAVRTAVFLDIGSAPLSLIRDLFQAETQCSVEAWNIVDGVSLLAENLLRRGGPLFLDDFLEGKFASFDANCGSAFEYDLPLASMLLSEVQNRLRSSSMSPNAELWRAGESLFAEWVATFRS